MIRIFYGDDRVKAQEEIRKILGEYEVIEGGEISASDMPSIFLGGSLFADKRAILIRDLGENKAAFEKLAEYVKTENEVVVFDGKIDKRTAAFKAIKAAGIEIREFKKENLVDSREVFAIFDMALKDGKKAVEMLEKIESEQDPFMLVGLMTSQAIKRLEWRQGEKEKRVLKELSKLDIQLKTTPFSSWSLLKSFLLQVSSL